MNYLPQDYHDAIYEIGPGSRSYRRRQPLP